MVAAWNQSAAPAGWSPSDSAAQYVLAGWYVASDVADSLSKVSGDTTHVMPNRSKWISPAYLGDLFQLTSASKPVYTDTSGVVFDGVDDAILTTVGTFTQPNTVIIALKVYRPTSNVTYADGSGASTRHTFYFNASYFGNYAGVEYTAGRAGSDPLSLDSTHVWTFTFNGAASYQRINGLQFVNGDVGAQSLTGLVLGAAYSGGNSSCAIREVLVYSESVTLTTISNAEAYLRNKYQ